jgi:amino acid adenylation domain-containing protein
MVHALRVLVSRHETLRSKISRDAQSQIILPTVKLDFPIIDLSAEPEANRQAKTEQILREIASRPFRRADAPPFRIVAVKHSDTEHLVLVTFLQLFSNSTSIAIFFKQLLTVYHDESAALPAGKQLSQFVAEHYQHDPTRNEQFWIDQVAEPPAPLDLPTDSSRGLAFSFRGDRVVRVISGALFGRIKKAASRNGATLFEFVLTATSVLLHRLSGQEDILIGVPFESEVRRRPGGAQLIACTSNLLPLRSRVSGNPSFSDHLLSIRNRVRSSFARREYFAPRLMNKLQKVYDPSRMPLFSVFFTGFNLELRAPVWRKNGLIVTIVTDGYPYNAPDESTINDLVFNLAYDQDHLEIHCDYLIDVFKRQTVERWLGHLQVLLEEAINNPDIGLWKIPLLPPSERQTIVHEWNRTAGPFPKEKSIDALFAERVAQQPDAIAIVHNERSITYGELDREANRLCHYLVRLGLKPGSYAGICLNRSIALVVAKLATLKAGAGYIPINIRHPLERRREMLAPAAMLITSSQGMLGSDRSGLLAVNLDQDSYQDESDEPLPRINIGESVIAVLYTSGSTGQPKGVKIPHRAVSALVLNTNYMTLEVSDAIAFRANIGFDVALFEIWGALLNGCRLVIIDREVQLSPSNFVREIRRQKVSRLWMTTSLFHLLAREIPDSFKGLRQVFIGGEPLDASSISKVYEHGAPEIMLNVYGPTETTAFSTTYLISGGSVTSHGRGIVPLGKPIANTQVYILDRFLAPVPIGVVGEVYIGGAGLAHGYIDAPALTAERFLQNPFSDDPNALFYKTGDLAKWLPDGSVQFVGRADFQVKIRGFRVELGEIESQLKAHPSVKNCVVTARKWRGEIDRQIVAYVTGKGIQIAILRDYLSEKLPGYMVPHVFVHLENLPLNINGKIDHEALPEPVLKSPGEPKVAPRDKLELRLVTLWQNTLKIPRVGTTENFFHLGGDSLLAMEIFLRIEKSLGKTLPPSILFTAPTIEKLAAIIRLNSLGGPSSRLVCKNSEGSEPPFFAIHGGLGEVFFYRELSAELGKNRPFYAVRSSGSAEGRTDLNTIEALADSYIDEIRAVQEHGPYLIGGYSFGGVVAFEMARRLQTRGEDVPLVVLFDTPNPSEPRRTHPLSSRVRKKLDAIANMPDGYKLKYLALRGTKKIEIQLRRIVSQLGLSKRLDDGKSWSILHPPHNRLLYQRMFSAYRPDRFSGRMAVFRAEYTVDGFEHLPDLGWTGYAQQSLEVLRVPGTHSSLLRSPHVRLVAEKLQTLLVAALQGQAEAGHAKGQSQ